MADELEVLYNSFHVRHFVFADDAMTVHRQNTLDLCDEIIRRGLRIAFFATTRVDCVDLEMLEKLKAAGCYEISYGIETASAELLRRIKKDTSLAAAYSAIELTKKAGLRACALLIAGNVGETAATIDETVDFLRKSGPEGMGTAGGLWILPGTELYRRSVQAGIINDDFWLGDEPYMVYTRENTARRIRLFAHALKTRIKISEMTPGYKASFFLRDAVQAVSLYLDKYPKSKHFLKLIYSPAKKTAAVLRDRI